MESIIRGKNFDAENIEYSSIKVLSNVSISSFVISIEPASSISLSGRLFSPIIRETFPLFLKIF